MKIFQQGDVVLVTQNIPNKKMKQKDEVIQWGEVTTHAHRVVMFRHDDKRTESWEHLEDETTGTRYLRVGKDGIDITHEEHKTIHVPPGEYEVRIVREYDHFAEEARQVVD